MSLRPRFSQDSFTEQIDADMIFCQQIAGFGRKEMNVEGKRQQENFRHFGQKFSLPHRDRDVQGRRRGYYSPSSRQLYAGHQQDGERNGPVLQADERPQGLQTAHPPFITLTLEAVYRPHYEYGDNTGKQSYTYLIDHGVQVGANPVDVAQHIYSRSAADR